MARLPVPARGGGLARTAAVCAARLIGLLGLAALGLAGPVAPAVAAEPISLVADGIERKYLLYRPGGAAPDTALPVVLLLHDADGDAAYALDHYGWTSAAEGQRFLVASLQATPLDPGSPAQHLRNPLVWTDGSGISGDRPPVDDIAYVRAVLADLPRHARIDEARVFAAGFGNGGAMAQRLAVELSDRISAAASVAGHLWVSGTLRRARPLYILFGAQDPLNPATGGAIPSPFQSDARTPAIGGTVAAWRAALRCPGEASSEASGGRVHRTVWAGCLDDSFLVFTLLTDLGHQWPGAGPGPLPLRLAGPTSDALPGAEDIWVFFRSAAEIPPAD